MVHPNGTFVLRVIGAFVDDVNSGLTHEGLQSVVPRDSSVLPKGDSVYGQTSINMQLYSNLLFTTGERPVLHKCAVYILSTSWVQGKNLNLTLQLR